MSQTNQNEKTLNLILRPLLEDPSHEDLLNLEQEIEENGGYEALVGRLDDANFTINYNETEVTIAKANMEILRKYECHRKNIPPADDLNSTQDTLNLSENLEYINENGLLG